MLTSLFGRVAAGDSEAVRECVDRFGGLVWALARRHSLTQEDAEDAVQEIFTALWESAYRYDDVRGSELTFVATIARRRLIDRRRARVRRGETPLEIADVPSIPPSQELAGEAALIARAIEQLRPEQRNLLVLSAYKGLTHEEIAQVTGIPLGTVKTHVRRGLLRVRELLQISAPASGLP